MTDSEPTPTPANPDPELERLCISVIRGLAMDAPHAARSGHQGTAMALAPAAHVLWTRLMKYDPEHPDWPDRDRFILSCGHASILQYALLHLTGYDLSLDDLKGFRQWGSRTPGHPEGGHTPGIEVTTGPLGQGFANAVGMAIAERRLRANLGRDLCDHHTWAFVSDGDLAEGVSHEAASLAGTLGLGRLNVLYDDNRISIDGPTPLWLNDDAPARFRSYGWSVIELGEAGEDLDALEAAFTEARADESAPTLIVVRTHIATPSPTWMDQPAAHGLSFDDASIAEAKEVMGLPADQSFLVPSEVADAYQGWGSRHRTTRLAWESRRRALDADRSARWEATWKGELLAGWEEALPVPEPGSSIATRQMSGTVLNALYPFLPALVAGGADLSGNTGTRLTDAPVLGRDEPGGSQVYWGVREHALGSAMVGMARHGGVVPVGGTFLVFSDYQRPAIRMAALSRARAIFVLTHDSVGVGEDGPTHQPVEHVMSLRLIPDLLVIRPADAHETVAAWRVALDHDGPTALILSRQNVPTLAEAAVAATDGVRAGGYALRSPEGARLAFVAAGSEVAVARDAADLLAAEGIPARVVSLPCWERFAQLTPAEREAVLPADLPTVAIEAGVTLGWERYADSVVGIDRFGASAPGALVMEHLGITPDRAAQAGRELLAPSP